MKKSKRKIAMVLWVILLVFLWTGCGAKETSSEPQGKVITKELVTTASEPEEIIPLYESPKDFYELIGKNIDICAWLEVPETNIDYPVTRTTDNKFYLTHDSYGTPFPGGGLFIDMGNSPDFSNPVTIVYGHVMPDDTIFSQLLKYADEDFFANNQKIIVYLPDNTLTYEIFAAFTNDTKNLLYEKNYAQKEQLEELFTYISEKEGLADVNMNMADVTLEDKILLLSTCTDEGAQRYIIAARLVAKDVE